MRHIVFALGVLGMAALSLLAFAVLRSQPAQEQEAPERLLTSQADTAFHETELLQEKPPRIVREETKGVYLTRWSAGSEVRVAQVLELARQGKVNSVVVDIKDSGGSVAYDSGVLEAAALGAERGNIKNIALFLERFHEAGLYVIARIAVFQDPVFAGAHPEYALRKESSPQELWTDNKGLAWVDPAARAAWEYNAALATDAFSRGFDEVNFDYVRFPSDGNLSDISYPVWDEEMPMREVISSFYEYLDAGLRNKVISVDLFGLAAADTWDDMGIGQVLEDALPFFDFISPMVYPSHFAPGFLGFKNPDEHPYEVVNFSLQRARERVAEFAKTRESAAKLRPWLQRPEPLLRLSL